MILYPQYDIERIANLTFKQQSFLLDGQSEVLEFKSHADYEKWLTRGIT